MRIAIVDDEAVYLNQLSATITSELAALGIVNERIDLFQSPAEFLDVWNGGYQLIFLDIYMAQDNGVDLARKIREQDQEVTLVFCTTSNEFAAQSYEVNAGYYLQKPITPEKISAMLRRVDFMRLEENQTITLPDGFRCILHKIEYTNYINHSVVYYLKDMEPHHVYMSHADAEKLLLPHSEFHTINKGNIVNFEMVGAIMPNAFKMRNGELLPISRRRFKEVAQEFADFQFQQMKRLAQ